MKKEKKNEPIVMYGEAPMKLNKERKWFDVYIEDVNIKNRKLKIFKRFEFIIKGLTFKGLRSINLSIYQSDMF
jgi:hypothetical protein